MHRFIRRIRAKARLSRSAFAAIFASTLPFLPAHGGLTITTVDTGGVGEYSSINLNAAGFPVISYYDRTNGNLKLATCGNATCSSPSPILVTVDGDPADVGQYTSMQLNGSGNPVVSYFDGNGVDPSLKIAICHNPTCTTSTSTLLDNAGFQPVGTYTSLQLALGIPKVSYFDNNNGGRLMFIACTDATCGSVGAPVAIDDPPQLVGTHTSLAISGMNPVISYYDVANGDLKLAVCADPACGTVTTQTLDSVGNVGAYTSLQVYGGNPMISYYDQTNNTLKLIVCANPICGAFVVRALDENGGGQFTSMRLGPTGAPIIAYRGSTGLKLVVCNDVTCSVPTISVVEGGNVGYDASLALDANGMPFISHYDANTMSLKIAAFSRARVVSVGVPAAGNYLTGQALTFTVEWPEAVTVTGAPELQVNIGGTVRSAAYVSGSGTATHTYSYTIDPADQDTDGIEVGGLVLNGGALVDSFGFSADLATSGVGPTTAVNVNAPWSVTVTAGPNGTVDPMAAQLVADGDFAAYTITPDFKFEPAFGGTCPAGTYAAPSYTTGAITGDCQVSVTFNQVLFTATPIAGANGVIVEGPQTLPGGNFAVFTVNPAPGHYAVMGGTCGGSLAGNTYQTAPLTQDCTVTANFMATPVTTFTGPSATGTGSITASFTGGGAACTFTVSEFIPVSGHGASPPEGSAPAGLVFPHGLFDFRTSGCTPVPGAAITMTITYPAALPPGSQYWKYGPTPTDPAPHWYVLTGAVFAGNTVTFTIVDGGLGDDDLLANGTIVDQGGPGVPGVGAVQTPTMSQWALVLLALLMLGATAYGSGRPAWRGTGRRRPR